MPNSRSFERPSSAFLGGSLTVETGEPIVDEGSPTARGFQHFYGTRGYIDSYFTIVPRTEMYLGEKQSYT